MLVRRRRRRRRGSRGSLRAEARWRTFVKDG